MRQVVYTIGEVIFILAVCSLIGMCMYYGHQERIMQIQIERVK